MSQSWIAQVLQEHTEAIQRHQRYIAAHEAIIQGLIVCCLQAITEAQAIAQLEEAAASQAELGMATLYRQAATALRQTQRAEEEKGPV